MNFFDKSNFDFLIEPEKQDINQEILIQDNNELEEEKKLLIYKAQSISIFKIIYHLSGKLEIFFIKYSERYAPHFPDALMPYGD